jgi:hypothetical protein
VHGQDVASSSIEFQRIDEMKFSARGCNLSALRDTAQEPGGSDWVQITRAGRDGIIPQLRGTYDPKES